MPSCNSPRPATSIESLSSDSRTRSATLPSASRSSRSRIMRPVTLVPSVPASGESLTRNVMASVGGSIGCAWIGVSITGSQMVWATVALGSPARATMSPASASSTGTRSRPAEGQHLGDAAGLDELAVVVEHLDGLVRLDRARADAAGDDAAEIGVGLQDGAEQPERPFLDRRRLARGAAPDRTAASCRLPCEPSRLVAIQPSLAEP